MYPIIITVPHASSQISDPKILERLALNEYEIFKFSDPFTGDLADFTCASFKHAAGVHRLVCDLNRAPNIHDAFHSHDFFGRKVFKDGFEFTVEEKKINLEKYWWPFHNEIIDSIFKLEEEDNSVILLVDLHNTSGDHPIGATGKYMPSVIISNLGKGTEGQEEGSSLCSIPMKHLSFFKEHISKKLHVEVDMNTIYKGGYNIIWTKQLREELKLNAKLYAVQIEYNLDYVFNPISKKIDRDAMHIMYRAFNSAIQELYERLWSEENKVVIETVGVPTKKTAK
ncbi:MAG: N-formylglutamate amidohydrolase [Candidatus Peregrinibacteria bacterium]|nr:N-formylglutamate amidohydrolase [Candidatus Peregrinibacteria bacterium]MDZ4244418.1 N-formylglutamate amidohydrolase [Candidatus Gracilibacteria bacterium]